MFVTLKVKSFDIRIERVIAEGPLIRGMESGNTAISFNS